MNNWLTHWNSDKHRNKKINNANLLKTQLKTSPKNVLEIGCGLAVESEILQKSYDCDLYLLDGDFDTTIGNRDISYGESSTMAFYNKVDTLKKSFNERNLKYTFIDANNISIPKDIKFDLIFSFESCGFHYPANTYKELILQHSHPNTMTIFDIRKKTLTEQQEDFDIKQILFDSKKYITAQILF